MQSKFIYYYNIEFKYRCFFDFAKILKKAYNFLKTSIKIAKLGFIDNKNNCINKLVDQNAKNNLLKYLFSDLFKLLNFAF